MDDIFRGFSSETLTLVVGPEAKQLFVQKDILLQIPYFRSALNSGEYIVSKEKTFTLPEDDPQAVADVLYFVYTNYVSELPSYTGDAAKESNAADACLKAYIAADKFMAEDIANSLLNELIRYYEKKTVSPRQIAILSAAGFEGSSLYKLFMRQMVWKIKDDQDFYAAYVASGASQDEPQHNWKGDCAQLEKEDLLRLAFVMGQPDCYVVPMQAAPNKPCMLHKQELSETCWAQP